MSATSDATWQRKCSYCGQPQHPGVCPMVKAIEYHENGNIKRVEFHGPVTVSLGPVPTVAQGIPASAYSDFGKARS